MIELGMNGIRLNCSHVSLVDAKEWIDALHEAMEITKKHVELVVDLKGPPFEGKDPDPSRRDDQDRRNI